MTGRGVVDPAVKSIVRTEAGIFVTSLYGPGAFAGYLIGFIAGKAGRVSAGLVQISCLALVGALLSLALRPQAMSGTGGAEPRQVTRLRSAKAGACQRPVAMILSSTATAIQTSSKRV